MNSRVAFTLAIALAVLAYFWLSMDPPPAPPAAAEVAVPAPPAEVVPPSSPAEAGE
jgi:hypothetical protein